MNKEAADVLKHIADKLDIPVQQLWAGLVAYAPFTYYEWLTTMVISASVIVIAACVIAWALWKAGKTEQEHYFGVALIAFLCAFVAVLIGWISGVGGMANALAAKNAPEAWASRYIIQRLGR